MRILPEAPTVLTDLRVAFSSSGTAKIQWSLNGAVIPGENAERLSKGGFAKGDTVTATVSADGALESAAVVIVNSPPRITSVPFSPQNIHAGVDISVDPAGSDPDGDMVQFRCRWAVNGQELPENTPVLKSSRFKRGDTVTLTVVPFDSETEGEPFLSQNMIIPNAPPQFVSEPPKDFQGDSYVYQVVARDPDGDTVTYSLASAPAGMTIDPNLGMISWKLDKQSDGTHAVEIVARDSQGLKASQKYSLTITMTGEVKNEKE